ncbi:hypothetical protein J4233_03130 [Candidatus Pacearchaeota archaeon]|nr:hypothetical protein [Candidatus Pacearchaeota archaeon]
MTEMTHKDTYTREELADAGFVPARTPNWLAWSDGVSRGIHTKQIPNSDSYTIHGVWSGLTRVDTDHLSGYLREHSLDELKDLLQDSQAVRNLAHTRLGVPLRRFYKDLRREMKST